MDEPGTRKNKRKEDKKRRSPDASPQISSTDVSRSKKRRRAVNLNAGQDPAIANTRTLRSRTRSQAHNASRAQSPHASVPADMGQTNAFFQNAHDFNISGNPSFQNVGKVINIYGGGIDHGLENLKPYVSFDAQFDSSSQDPDRRCHPGTRETVLQRLREWFDDPNSTERIIWLFGPAGAGKSAIAQTIAHFYDRPKVSATFFFFRSDVNRNDGNRLFPTLAYQLAFSIPATKELIANSLNERPDLPRTAVERQFNELLVRPFQALNKDDTQLSPVIIIDGIDECSCEQLQRRFLKIIGDSVLDADDRFPLRFLIVSRPEIHIEQTIRRFQTPVLRIDLAELDDSNRDIEKYLEDEFARIVSEKGFEPTWPGPEIIRRIVYKSSGNFIFAALVIRFVDDPHSFAKTQLDIVMNMKPPKTMSPFAILDQLFLEILRQVQDQDFLKRYLALLTARISVSRRYGDLFKDDVMLMHVSEEELHANLSRMRSLLKFNPSIDLHHKSFLDFLHNSSRSGEYYIGQPGGIRRYTQVVVDSLARYVSTMIKQPNHRNAPYHFTPKFRTMIKTFPRKVGLSVKAWPEVMEPLLDIQDNLLQISNSAPTTDPCDKCFVFSLLRELLFLEMLNGQSDDASVQSVMNVRQRKGVVSSTRTKRKKMKKKPDSILLSLFNHLPEMMDDWSPDKHVMRLMNATLAFDSSEIARRVRFISDAQKLVDLLVYLIDEKSALGNSKVPDAPRKATRLALEIFARVPVFLPSPSCHGDNMRQVPWKLGIPIQILSQTIFASRILDRRYVVPILAVEKKEGAWLVSGDPGGNGLPMEEWRQSSIPSSVEAVQVMLGLAKIIQYIHSMDIVLHGDFGSNDVFLDSALNPKICCLCTFSRIPLEQPLKAWFSPADNIFSFGCLFYELFSTVDTKPLFSTEQRRRLIANPPYKIPEYAWQLIQQCCAHDPGSRATIDEIVRKIESWKIIK